MSRIRNSGRLYGLHRKKGFSLFELVVAIVIIGVLAAVLLQRLNYYKEMMEKAAMELTLRNIKTGLQLHLAELIVTNCQQQAPQLETQDPMQWLEIKPPNYAGAYRGATEAATWYYDQIQHQLLYVVNSGSRLEIDTDQQPKVVRFHVRLIKDRLISNGTAVESVNGVVLLPVHPYRWQ